MSGQTIYIYFNIYIYGTNLAKALESWQLLAQHLDPVCRVAQAMLATRHAGQSDAARLPSSYDTICFMTSRFAYILIRPIHQQLDFRISLNCTSCVPTYIHPNTINAN